MSDLVQKIADAVEVALGDDGHCVVYKNAATVAQDDEEFSTEGVERLAAKLEREGQPILAHCLRGLAQQRDDLKAVAVKEAIRQSLGSTQERGEAVARLLYWVGPGNIGRPSPIARTFTEYPVGTDGDKAYWAEGEPLYAHPDSGRAAELEAELSAERKDHLCSKTQAHARIAALESQLTESREREGRMRAYLWERGHSPGCESEFGPAPCNCGYRAALAAEKGEK